MSKYLALSLGSLKIHFDEFHCCEFGTIVRVCVCVCVVFGCVCVCVSVSVCVIWSVSNSIILCRCENIDWCYLTSWGLYDLSWINHLQVVTSILWGSLWCMEKEREAQPSKHHFLTSEYVGNTKCNGWWVIWTIQLPILNERMAQFICNFTSWMCINSSHWHLWRDLLMHTLFGINKYVDHSNNIQGQVVGERCTLVRLA